MTQNLCRRRCVLLPLSLEHRLIATRPPPNTHMHQGVLNNSRPGLQTCSVQGQLADTTLLATEPQLSPLTPQVRLESLRTNNKQMGAAGFPQNFTSQNRQVRSECLENYNATQ